MDQELQDAKQEITYWKNVAIYLADCHAATAMTLLDKKSMPYGNRDINDVVNRCNTAKTWGNINGHT